MQTRSSGPVDEPSPSSTPRRRRNKKRSQKQDDPTVKPVVTMADQRTMAELLRAPTEGYAEAIVVPPIPADHFELKHSLINLVTLKLFYGFEKEDPHSHIRYFNKITSTLKYKDVPESSIKLMLFPFSVGSPAQIWLDKEPARSILTWDDLVSKFINHFFPPSKTTNLRNEISNFQQLFDESFYEAWNRFKDLLRACPHHGFTKLHQLDTFYNGLYPSDQDSLNFAAGGNILERSAQDVLKIIENKSKVRNSRNKPIVSQVKVTSAMATMFKQHQVTPPLASIKAVEESCVTCVGAHSFRQCLATDSNTFSGYQDNTQGYGSVAAVNYNAGSSSYRPQGDRNLLSYRSNNYLGPPGFNQPNNPNNLNFQNRNNQNQFQNRSNPGYPNQGFNQSNRGQNFNQANQMTKMEKAFNERPQCVLPSNTIPNPREDLKVITTRSGVNLVGPSVPLPYPSSNEMFKKLHFNISFAEALAQMPKYAKMLKDLLTNKEKLLELANTPLNENCSTVILKKLPKKLRDTARFLIPCEFHGLKSCMALADLGVSINLMPFTIWKTLSLLELSTTRMTLELATRTIAIPADIAEDVFVQVGKFTFPADFVVVDYEVDPRIPLILGRPFLRTAHALVDVHGKKLTLRVRDEELVFNIESTLKHPQKDGDESINQIDILDTTCEDHFHEVLNLINPMSGSITPSSDLVDVSLPPSLTPFGDSDFILEEIDTFLASYDSISPDFDDGTFDMEGDIRLIETLLNNDNPTNDLPPSTELKSGEIKTTKSSIEDPPKLELKDLPPYLEYAFLEGTSKLPIIIAKDLKKEEKDQLISILMKDDYKPVVQQQRRVNPKIHEVIKEDVIKLLDAGLIYPISDSPWVSPVHVVPKKGSITMVTNENNELIPTRLVTGWRVYIGYRKLNDSTRKDHFPLPFMDQMLERLAGNEFYCFLDGFSGYFQIPIDPQDQEKTTFTCPYGTFAYCHKISNNGIEVDHAKVDVITKLPPPTTIKGIRSFLAHASFYRRFIQDFSKIAQPMTHLLEKETPFVLSQECMESFEILKTKLTEAPILVSPD
ncbi:reverse transcriptase domain-containing protein [Tanacetum coccineum]